MKNTPTSSSCLQHGDREHRIAGGRSAAPSCSSYSGSARHVHDVDGPALEGGAPASASRGRPDHVLLASTGRNSGRDPVVRDQSGTRRRRSAGDRPPSAPARRVAFSTSVWSTGWRSNVERLITLSTSLVAVCCSSATRSSSLRACQLGEQPHVLDGDDGLVGEGLNQLDLRLGEGLHPPATAADRPDRHAVADDRNPQVGSIGRRLLQHLQRPRIVVGIGPHVLDVHRPAVDEGAANDEVAGRRAREQAPVRRRLGGRHVAHRDEVEEAVIDPRHRAELRVAQAGRARDDGLEHGLGIGRRARDDLEDLARRRLTLLRLGLKTCEPSALCSLPGKRLPQRGDLGGELSLGGRPHQSRCGACSRGASFRNLRPIGSVEVRTVAGDYPPRRWRSRRGPVAVAGLDRPRRGWST